jgi:hypothetical protein
MPRGRGRETASGRAGGTPRESTVGGQSVATGWRLVLLELQVYEKMT